MEGREPGGPSPEDMSFKSPEIKPQPEAPPAPAEQKTEDRGPSEPHKSRDARKFERIVREDEERRKSPVAEGAPKSEFEKSLVETLRNPEMAHEIALAIKPLIDLAVQTKTDIERLFSELEESSHSVEWERQPNETEKDYEIRKEKLNVERYIRTRDVEDRINLLRDILPKVRGNERDLIHDFERLRSAKSAGGDGVLEVARGFLYSYISNKLDAHRLMVRSAELDKKIEDIGIEKFGSFMDRTRLFLRKMGEDFKEDLTGKDSLARELWKVGGEEAMIPEADREGREILKSLGIEGVDSIKINWQ